MSAGETATAPRLDDQRRRLNARRPGLALMISPASEAGALTRRPASEAGALTRRPTSLVSLYLQKVNLNASADSHVAPGSK